jgi:methylated-DNA-[protein]-cysteine S-methyltransferase
MKYELLAQSPIGSFVITTDEVHVLSVHVLDVEMPAAPPSPTPLPEVALEAERQLLAYFAGERQDFDLPLAPEGTAFQRKVWGELLKIPYGKTITYAQLAERLGDPKCIRAAGLANGRNPIWVIVPCHRVVGSNGSLVGYAGGLYRKQWLLQLELANSPVPAGQLF